MVDRLILTDAFEVPDGEGDEFVSAREETRDYLRSQLGYIGTSVHQATGPAADFRFANIARLRSAEDLMAATQSAGFRDRLQVWPGAVLSSLTRCRWWLGAAG